MKRLQILLASAMALSLLSCGKENEKERIKPGDPLPEFYTYTVEGINVSRDSFIGHPGLIIFFTTTCPDCHRQLPHVQRAYESLWDKAVFLAVSMNEDRETAQKFWEQTRFTVPLATPGKAFYNLFNGKSRPVVPLIILTDSNGIVTAVYDDNTLLTDIDLYNQLTLKFDVEIK